MRKLFTLAIVAYSIGTSLWIAALLNRIHQLESTPEHPSSVATSLHDQRQKAEKTIDLKWKTIRHPAEMTLILGTPETEVDRQLWTTRQFRFVYHEANRTFSVQSHLPETAVH